MSVMDMIEANTIHGDSIVGRRTPEYIAWGSIVQRCTNPKNPAYARYGGRGILICEEWRRDFSAFLNHVGRRPSSAHTIDRHPDPDGNYEPGNVRWATRAEQALNKSSLRFITIDGETRCSSEWARIAGIGRETMRQRVARGETGRQLLRPAARNKESGDQE